MMCLGVLVVSNTSIASLSIFANLVSVGTNAALLPDAVAYIPPVSYGGSNYTVIVTGLACTLLCLLIVDLQVGNARLTDLGNILSIQSSSLYGTLIADNSALCFNPSGQWGHRKNSYLEFSLLQV